MLLRQCMQMVLAQPPWDMSSEASDSDWVSLKDYHHIAILFGKHTGTAGQDPTITMEQAQDTSGTNAKPLNFTSLGRKQGVDLLSTGIFTEVTQTAAATYTNATLAEEHALIVIEFDTSDLDTDNGFDCIRATVADVGAAAQDGFLLYLLCDARFAQKVLGSAL